MTSEQALSIRSLHKSYAIPYLQGLFGEGFDYFRIRGRRMELINEYLKDNPLELKDGAVELLAFLNENRLLTAVATATDYERTRDYLTRVGIFDKFDRIVCATMVERGKPSPDIYIYAAEQLGLKTGECMALEDSPNGVKSAVSAGCRTVMVPDLTEPDEDLKGLDFEKVSSLNDIAGLLKADV